MNKFNSKIEELQKKLQEEIDKINPLREKNLENSSKIQRLNLELKSLDEETERIKRDIVSNKNSLRFLRKI